MNTLVTLLFSILSQFWRVVCFVINNFFSYIPHFGVSSNLNELGTLFVVSSSICSGVITGTQNCNFEKDKMHNLPEIFALSWMCCLVLPFVVMM